LPIPLNSAKINICLIPPDLVKAANRTENHRKG
jgi:hypothetical protein